MSTLSSATTRKVVPMPSPSRRSRITLLQEMAREAEQLAEQADRIKKLRALARKTGETAANEIGVSYRTYQRWEGGEGEISTDNLKRLAAYYGTTADYIEYGRMEQTPTPDLFPANGADPLSEILRLLRRLDERLSDAETARSRASAEQLARYVEVLKQLGDIQAASESPAARRRRTA